MRKFFSKRLAALMMAAGLLLLILLGWTGAGRRRIRADEEAEGSSFNTGPTHTGPPGGGTSRAAPEQILKYPDKATGQYNDRKIREGGL